MRTDMAGGSCQTESIYVRFWEGLVMKGIEELYKKQEHCDLTLRFPSRDIKAHRVVLLSCSPFFTGLLKGKACGHKIVEMPPQMDADAMAAILSFMYTGRLQSHLDLASLHTTASMIQLNALVSLLETRLSVSNNSVSTDTVSNMGRHKHNPCANIVSSERNGSSVKTARSVGGLKNRKLSNKQKETCVPVFDNPPISSLRPSRFECPLDLAALCLPVDCDTGPCIPPHLSLVKGERAAVSSDADLRTSSGGSSKHPVSTRVTLSPVVEHSKLGGRLSDARSISSAAISRRSSQTAGANSSSELAAENHDQLPEFDSSSEVHSLNSLKDESAIDVDKSAIEPRQSLVSAELLTCSLCPGDGQTQLAAAEMPVHLERHHSSTKIVPRCIECSNSQTGASFSDVLEYVRHVEDVHVAGAGAGTCHVCGYTTARWLDLIYHRRIRHQSTPPLFVSFPRCDRCDFEAISFEHLSLHRQRRHRGSAPLRHKCRQCSEYFKSNSQLEVHVRKKHASLNSRRSSDLWPCQFCGISFSRSYNLKGHLRSVHRVLSSAVDYCRVAGPLVPAGLSTDPIDPATVTRSAVTLPSDGENDQLLRVKQQSDTVMQSVPLYDHDVQHVQSSQSVPCELYFSAIDGNTSASSGGPASSVIPVQDENGVVSYIALQTAPVVDSLSPGPDGSALLEITSLAHPSSVADVQHQQDMLLAQRSLQLNSVVDMNGTVLTDSSLMTGTSAAFDGAHRETVLMADCLDSHTPVLTTSICSNLTPNNQQRHNAHLFALPSVSTLTAVASSGHGDSVHDTTIKTCYQPSVNSATADWSEMMPSVLTSTNQQQPRM